MVKFILVRHGFTTFNKEKRCQGQYDSPLDEIGIKQATHAKLKSEMDQDKCEFFSSVPLRREFFF